VYPQIIYFRSISHEINHPAIKGVPPLQETPIAMAMESPLFADVLSTLDDGMMHLSLVEIAEWLKFGQSIYPLVN
jgi:hypothetical protein